MGLPYYGKEQGNEMKNRFLPQSAIYLIWEYIILLADCFNNLSQTKVMGDFEL